jgi:molecular chaperone HtpG
MTHGIPIAIDEENKKSTMATGKINVQTENIFPIIKKFLYSDHEIFLRELVANATDATQKLKTLSSIGEFKGDIGETTIRISINKEAKTLTVSDKGIGMTGAEIEKYITQIAFSGAEEFVNKYKDKAQGIIGHFGLGFYSAFMVAKKVEIISKSFQDAPAVKWECDGSPEYTLTETEKKERGTDIILHIADDSEEFLEESRISGILKKYCKFLPVEIAFGKSAEKVKDDAGNESEIEKEIIINNTQPAWVKTPSSLTDEDYKNFYHELYPFADEPLFHIHLNVDYPFNLTGILYFPKLKNNVEVQKNKIQLYCNQVFVTDSVEGIVPDFLTLLHGVIDSPDIPLNVSRSYLQSDGNVKKIASHITKKVSDKLEEMFKNDRADFEKKWDDIKVFIQYGMLTDEKFFERAGKFALYKNYDAKYFTMEEYKEKVKPVQTDKDDQLILLYTNDKKAQHSFIESAIQRAYDVLEIEGPLAPHFISKIESTNEKCSFARVDSDTIDKLIKKTEDLPSKLSQEEQDQMKPVFEKDLDTKTYHVSFQSMSETDQPAIITQTEFMRRMKEQEALGGGGFYGTLPEMYNVVINANHPLISKIKETENTDAKEQMAQQVIDLALLSQGMLKGEKLTQFVKRSVDLIGK